MTKYLNRTVVKLLKVTLTYQQAVVLDLLNEQSEITGEEWQLHDIKNLSAVISGFRDLGIEIVTIPAAYAIDKYGRKSIHKPLKYALAPGVSCKRGLYVSFR